MLETQLEDEGGEGGEDDDADDGEMSNEKGWDELLIAEDDDDPMEVLRTIINVKPWLRPSQARAKLKPSPTARPDISESPSCLKPGQSHSFQAKPGRNSTREGSWRNRVPDCSWQLAGGAQRADRLGAAQGTNRLTTTQQADRLRAAQGTNRLTATQFNYPYNLLSSTSNSLAMLCIYTDISRTNWFCNFYSSILLPRIHRHLGPT